MAKLTNGDGTESVIYPSEGFEFLVELGNGNTKSGIVHSSDEQVVVSFDYDNRDMLLGGRYYFGK